MSRYDSYKPPGNPISVSKMNALKDSAILSLNEFNRIKESLSPQKQKISGSQILNTDSINQNNEKSLKFKIQEYDKNHPSSFFSVDRVKNEDPYKVVGKANDVVKIFDRLSKNAKVATIRDKQLDERKIMENMFVNKEKRLDFMMELERLKEIEFLEKKYKDSRKLNKEGCKVVIDQILDNERGRNKKREMVERERILMMRQIEKLKEEEKQKAIYKKLEAEARNREQLEVNRISQLAKQKQKIDEKEENLKIMKFNEEKLKQEEEFLREKKRLQIQKEKEIQALREKQERALDKQGEIDEIRAKRAYQQAELLEKQKEEQERLKKQKMMKEIIECNEKQKLDKKKVVDEEIQKDKELYLKIQNEYQKELEEQKIKKKIQMEKFIANKIDLEKQISDKENQKKMQRMSSIEEGIKVKNEQDNYLASLEEIRKQKIKELKDLNVKEKYIVPLEKFNYSKIEDRYATPPEIKEK